MYTAEQLVAIEAAARRITWVSRSVQGAVRDAGSIAKSTLLSTAEGRRAAQHEIKVRKELDEAIYALTKEVQT